MYEIETQDQEASEFDEHLHFRANRNDLVDENDFRFKNKWNERTRGTKTRTIQDVQVVFDLGMVMRLAFNFRNLGRVWSAIESESGVKVRVCRWNGGK